MRDSTGPTYPTQVIIGKPPMREQDCCRLSEITLQGDSRTGQSNIQLCRIIVDYGDIVTHLSFFNCTGCPKWIYAWQVWALTEKAEGEIIKQ